MTAATFNACLSLAVLGVLTFLPAGVNTESVCILTYINKAVSVIGSEPDG